MVLYCFNFRCFFEVDRLVAENNMKFVGATWYTAAYDPYVAYAYLLFGLPAEQACAFIPGYEDPCPPRNGKLVSSICFTA